MVLKGPYCHVYKFEYKVGNTIRQIQSHLVIEGKDCKYHMRKTVGLPLGVTAKLLLENKIKVKEYTSLPSKIYEPVLDELSRLAYSFRRDTFIQSSVSNFKINT